MRPVHFEEANIELSKPADMTDEECMSVSAFSNGQQIITAWELNKEELELIAKTGRVYLSVFAVPMPPVALFIESPFTEATPVTREDVFMMLRENGREDIADACIDTLFGMELGITYAVFSGEVPEPKEVPGHKLIILGGSEAYASQVIMSLTFIGCIHRQPADGFTIIQRIR